MTMTLEEFAQMVADHDLTYSYSDDHRCWQSGQAQYDKIMLAAKLFPPEEVKAIWNGQVDQKLIPEARSQFYWRDDQ